MSELAPSQAAAVENLRAGLDVERNFEIVFRTWHRNVRSYYENRGLEPQEANDLAQEVFLTVYTGISGLRDQASFRSWLFGIARFKLLQHLESKGKAAFSPVEDEPLPDPAPSGLEIVLDSERRTKLREALEELPQQMRACVKMSVVEDLQYAEIAERLGVSVNSVKVQIHRARKVLAQRLGPLFQTHFLLWIL